MQPVSSSDITPTMTWASNGNNQPAAGGDPGRSRVTSLHVSVGPVRAWVGPIGAEVSSEHDGCSSDF